jgi:hypothetical protein
MLDPGIMKEGPGHFGASIDEVYVQKIASKKKQNVKIK